MKRESDPMMVVAYVVWAIALAVVIISMAIFLSSQPAGASHGKPGHVVSDRCRSVNPRSGTSYRMVAAVIQPYRYTSVFETGTKDIEYILQWPRLPSVAEQLIKVARERLSVIMVAASDEKDAPRRHRILVERRQLTTAIGMACLFGGIMVFAVASTCGKNRRNK